MFDPYAVFRSVVDAIDQNFAYQLISIALTALAIFASRHTLYRLYLRLTMYTPRFGYDKGLNQALLQLFSTTNRAVAEPDKSERDCEECKTSTFGVAKPVVEIVDIGLPGRQRVVHRECLAKSRKWELDFDLNGRRVRLVNLMKLWKYQGRPSRLETRDPPLYAITMLDPKKNVVDFILCTFNSVEKLRPDSLPGLAETLPKSKDGKPWNLYHMGLATLGAVRVQSTIPDATITPDMIPALLEGVHEIGLTNAFGKENPLAGWVRRKRGHSYRGSRKPPYNPCGKCGRIHLPT